MFLLKLYFAWVLISSVTSVIIGSNYIDRVTRLLHVNVGYGVWLIVSSTVNLALFLGCVALLYS